MTALKGNRKDGEEAVKRLPSGRRLLWLLPRHVRSPQSPGRGRGDGSGEASGPPSARGHGRQSRMDTANLHQLLPRHRGREWATPTAAPELLIAR